MPVPAADAIELTDDERAALEGFVRRRTSARGLAQRSEIVLEAAAGRTNTEIAERLRVPADGDQVAATVRRAGLGRAG